MDMVIPEQLKTALKSLHTRVTLLDGNGRDLVTGEESGLVPSDGPPSGHGAQSGRILRKSRIADGLFYCAQTDKADAAQDVFQLLDVLLQAVLPGKPAGGGRNEGYRRLLLNTLSVTEAEKLADEYHLSLPSPCSVYLMQLTQLHKETAWDVLTQILPLSKGDVLVSLDQHAAVFLRASARADDDEGGMEAMEFAQAVQESVLSETGYELTIGIGAPAGDIFSLHASYQQARRAIEIGRVFCGEKTIHDYATMLLPRFLADLSPDMAEHYYHLLFNESTARLLNDEMLKTITAFFEKDLNLSDTARCLFIHRNTLVYRLDKLQRAFGLDLRKFDDAVTFRILMELKKCRDNHHTVHDDQSGGSLL